MEREFALQGLRGVLFCREEGQRCQLRAEGEDDGRGLYKIYLHGESGTVLVGTLMPEQGTLRLRRSMSIAELRRKGCWPIVSADAELAFAFENKSKCAVPEGWQRAERPADLLQDGILRASAAEGKDGVVRWEKGGFLLALPYEEQKPFPLVPLFCLGTLRELERRRYVVYRFDRAGKPQIPNGKRN